LIFRDFDTSRAPWKGGTLVAFHIRGCRLKTCEDLGRTGLTADLLGSSLFHLTQKLSNKNFSSLVVGEIRGHFEKARREGESMPGFFFCSVARRRLPI
jgi:hypothetical protein